MLVRPAINRPGYRTAPDESGLAVLKTRLIGCCLIALKFISGRASGEHDLDSIDIFLNLMTFTTQSLALFDWVNNLPLTSVSQIIQSINIRQKISLGLTHIPCSIGPCARLKTPTRGYTTPIYRCDHPEIRKS